MISKARDAVLVILFVAMDMFAIYSYGLMSNFAAQDAIIFGAILAGLLDIPPYLFAAAGFGKILDPITDLHKGERRVAILVSLLGIFYIVLIFTVLFIVRYEEVIVVFNTPERFQERFTVSFTTILPLLTSIASFVTGMITSKNASAKEQKTEAKKAAADKTKHANAENKLAAEIYGKLAKIGDISSVELIPPGSGNLNFTEIFGGKMTGIIGKINAKHYEELYLRYKTDLSLLHTRFAGFTEEIKLKIDECSPEEGIISQTKIPQELEVMFASLAEPDEVILTELAKHIAV
ncbi:MAG: hypothetical protein LBS21_00250 [Clostridiales bacterium]|jgi:hypothetical protein|nr:hypothetical protein [Clostridiales bacterium]